MNGRNFLKSVKPKNKIANPAQPTNQVGRGFALLLFSFHLPVILDPYSLVLTGPRWHRGYDKTQWILASIAELKTCSRGDRYTGTRTDIHNFLPVSLFAPDLPVTLDKVPNLFNRPMFNHQRHAMWRKGAVR